MARNIPAHALMAEASLALVAERCMGLAARLLAKASALPKGDQLWVLAEADPPSPSRLSSVTGWRRAGREVWGEAGTSPPIEAILPSTNHRGRHTLL